jgi:hypothetical protein
MPDVLERSEALKTKENYCPFGCQDTDLDEYGYCHHLVGFTNNGHTAEMIRPLIRLDKEKVPYDTGYKSVQGGKRAVVVEKADKLVNPESKVAGQDGITRTVKKWVSTRVYRDLPKPAEREPLSTPPLVDDEIAVLMEEKRELERKLQKKKLEDEIAALREECRNEIGDDELDKMTAPKKG